MTLLAAGKSTPHAKKSSAETMKAANGFSWKRVLRCRWNLSRFSRNRKEMATKASESSDSVWRCETAKLKRMKKEKLIQSTKKQQNNTYLP
jgi:hypothetical protein